ncbi:hypothetical protein WDW89_00980 [Deltaproteobacteria bacterium TL4]
MIDKQVMALIEKMNKQLPIPAYPTEILIRNMNKKNIKFSKQDNLKIDSVLYLGNEGGIGCAISGPQKLNTVLVISITHLLIKSDHPLANEIKNYQRERIEQLAKNYP